MEISTNNCVVRAPCLWVQDGLIRSCFHLVRSHTIQYSIDRGWGEKVNTRNILSRNKPLQSDPCWHCKLICNQIIALNIVIQQTKMTGENADARANKEKVKWVHLISMCPEYVYPEYLVPATPVFTKMTRYQVHGCVSWAWSALVTHLITPDQGS